ncbi:MAG: RNA methyltransferase [Planctomycetes bacterium]|nr:RNA methyltransferase [Planctomycetota bacterium]
MTEDAVIRSRTNALLKRVGAALAGRERDVVVLEGERLVRDALRAGVELEVALVAESRAAELGDLAAPLRVVADELLARASALESSPGVLALARPPQTRTLDALNPRGARLVLVVAGVQDPGNLGALARSAEAAGAGALVCLAGGARPFGPKALRGSMGSLLRLPVHAAAEAAALADTLAARGYRQVCAATRGGARWDRFDWSGPIALWVSGETSELPDVTARFEHVTIPMHGDVESLNVTVAASLLLFAAGGGA